MRSKQRITPKELKQIRESFDFTQAQMGRVLGVHPNALQNFEYGKNPVPLYISYAASALTLLNINKLLKEYIINVIKIEL